MANLFHVLTLKLSRLVLLVYWVHCCRQVFLRILHGFFFLLPLGLLDRLNERRVIDLQELALQLVLWSWRFDGSTLLLG